MTDQEIMSLSDWNEALDEMIDEFRRTHNREPSQLELDNLIEILINRYRELGYLIKHREKKQSKGYGMEM